MSDKNFYLVFAYPTTSGALHVGHIRSYTLPDIIASHAKPFRPAIFMADLNKNKMNCSKI